MSTRPGSFLTKNAATVFAPRFKFNKTVFIKHPHYVNISLNTAHLVVTRERGFFFPIPHAFPNGVLSNVAVAEMWNSSLRYSLPSGAYMVVALWFGGPDGS